MVVVGLVLPVAAVVLACALAVALVVPPAGPGRRARTPAGREAELRGRLAADVVDLVQGAPELLAFGARGRVLGPGRVGPTGP